MDDLLTVFQITIKIRKAHEGQSGYRSEVTMARGRKKIKEYIDNSEVVGMCCNYGSGKGGGEGVVYK